MLKKDIIECLKAKIAELETNQKTMSSLFKNEEDRDALRFYHDIGIDLMLEHGFYEDVLDYVEHSIRLKK